LNDIFPVMSKRRDANRQLTHRIISGTLRGLPSRLICRVKDTIIISGIVQPLWEKYDIKRNWITGIRLGLINQEWASLVEWKGDPEAAWVIMLTEKIS
jgi:hypothetical protein